MTKTVKQLSHRDMLIMMLLQRGMKMAVLHYAGVEASRTTTTTPGKQLEAGDTTRARGVQGVNDDSNGNSNRTAAGSSFSQQLWSAGGVW